MNIRIPYLDTEGHIDVRARRVGALTFELESYAGVIPLVPGDVVEITGVDQDGVFTATAVDTLRDCWLYEVHTRTPNMLTNAAGDIDIDGLDDLNWMAAELAADEMERQLQDYCQVARPSRFTVQVATDDNAWLVAFIRTQPSIDSFTIVRFPGAEVDLDFERADLGITGDRPTYRP